MALYVSDVIKQMEEIAPPDEALSYDNVGLMTGSCLHEVKSVMVCLDLTEIVLEEALAKGCEMVITHHPIIFDPINRISEDTAKGSFLSKIIRSNISVFSAHTNLDCANEGVNYSLAKALHLQDIKGEDYKLGTLLNEMTRKEFVIYVSKMLCTKQISVIDRQPNRNSIGKISKVGVFCGAFDGQSKWVIENNLDVLVTGELKHHNAIELRDDWIFTVSAGHYATEFPGMIHLAKLLQSKIPEITILLSERDTNAFISFDDYTFF